MSLTDDRELSRFAAELAHHELPRAPRAFRARLRASLIAAELEPPRRSPLEWLRFPALRPLLAAVLVLAILAGAGGSAAATSLPGDPAFGLKRAVEEAQVALTFDDADRLDTLLDQSARRLGDLDTASSARPSALSAAIEEYLAAVARVDAAVRAVSSQPPTAKRAAALARAAAAGTDHIALLQELLTRLPAQAQPGIQRAIEAQQAVHGKSDNAPGRPVVPFESAAPRVPGPPEGAPGRPTVPVRTPPPTSAPRRP